MADVIPLCQSDMMQMTKRGIISQIVSPRQAKFIEVKVQSQYTGWY